MNGPFPKDVLDLPVLASICLFGSSFTVVMAEKMLHKGSTFLFQVWWLVTMVLGAAFLCYTGTEWYRLIYHNGLTISTNIFGTTFYSLVGLHASHVIVGLILLSLVIISSLRGKLHPDHYEHVEMISWYWHFVDAVWLVVLSVVYIFGR
ncbi:MAG: cytochrome c oxidase subunit 3 [Chthoniobacterales bacterium]